MGPAPRDPNDPDLWDWGEDDDSRPRRHPWRAVLAAVIVLSLVLLLLDQRPVGEEGVRQEFAVAGRAPGPEPNRTFVPTQPQPNSLSL